MCHRMETGTNMSLYVILLYTVIAGSLTYVQGESDDLKVIGATNRSNYNNGTNGTRYHDSHKGIHIFVNMFDHVSRPFIVCCWILLVSLAKVAFHSFDALSESIPESCLLILLGVPVGFILEQAGVTGHLFLTSDLFFQYLLPPIIFDAGYFINSTSFFANIGTILLYAILGTIANTFLVGASMYGTATTASVEISLLHSFLFGALISAVDPVAVLTVFEEVQVNEVLYMLVFGESVLNDAASVVLYRTFENLPEDNIDGVQVGLAIGSFFVVSIFGTLIGIIFGLVASFITRFTDHVRVIEPIFVFIMAYMAYLTAEIFHFSGIMSILFCGLVMKPYVESNISRKSHTTTKYFLKMLASSCEAVIFMFLGIALVQYSHNFNIQFIAWCIFFISIFRVFGIVSLTWLANKFARLDRVSTKEQLIMSYGGLRGAVAFCLAIVLDEGVTKQSRELKQLLVTTTLAVIIFTCFLQGATMKKLVEKLGVKKADQREISMFEHLDDKVLSYTIAGIEEVLGVHGHGFWNNIMEFINQKLLRPCLTRNPEMALDDALLQHERKVECKESIHTAEYNKSCSEDIQQNGSSAIVTNPNVTFLPFERGLSICSIDSTGEGAPTITVINPNDFAHLIPHANDANKIKPRRKYSDATVGLHHDQWDELTKAGTIRDGYGNIIPKGHKKPHRHHSTDSRGHRHHDQHRHGNHHKHRYQTTSDHGSSGHRHHQHHSGDHDSNGHRHHQRHHSRDNNKKSHHRSNIDTVVEEDEGEEEIEMVESRLPTWMQKHIETDTEQTLQDEEEPQEGKNENELPVWMKQQIEPGTEQTLQDDNENQFRENSEPEKYVGAAILPTQDTIIDIESTHDVVSNPEGYTPDIPTPPTDNVPDSILSEDDVFCIPPLPTDDVPDNPMTDTGARRFSEKNEFLIPTLSTNEVADVPVVDTGIRRFSEKNDMPILHTPRTITRQRSESTASSNSDSSLPASRSSVQSPASVTVDIPSSHLEYTNPWDNDSKPEYPNP